MATLDDLLNHINFTPEELEHVDGALKRVEETIDAKAEDGKIPTALRYRKFGSIARKTKKLPLDDVDVLYVVGEAQKQNYSDSHILIQRNFTFGPDMCEPDDNISSVYLLNKIKKAIKETYPKSDIARNNEVVNIYFDSYSVGFDIVPAFYIPNMGYYLIPEGGGNHRWKKTKPEVGENLLSTVNNKHNNHARDTLKIIKHWFEKKQIRSAGSYHLEMVLCKAFEAANYVKTTLRATLIFAYANINYSGYLHSCPDPSGLGDNLTSGLSSDDISKIVTEAEVAKDKLSEESKFVEYIDPEVCD